MTFQKQSFLCWRQTAVAENSLTTILLSIQLTFFLCPTAISKDQHETLASWSKADRPGGWTRRTLPYRKWNEKLGSPRIGPRIVHHH